MPKVIFTIKTHWFLIIFMFYKLDFRISFCKKIKFFVCPLAGVFWEWFLVDFGAISGAKFGPKLLPNAFWNGYEFWCGFRFDFFCVFEGEVGFAGRTTYRDRVVGRGRGGVNPSPGIGELGWLVIGNLHARRPKATAHSCNTWLRYSGLGILTAGNPGIHCLGTLA